MSARAAAQLWHAVSTDGVAEGSTLRSLGQLLANQSRQCGTTILPERPQHTPQNAEPPFPAGMICCLRLPSTRVNFETMAGPKARTVVKNQFC